MSGAKRWDATEQAEVIRRYTNGDRVEDIARDCGRSRIAVQLALGRWGTESRGRGTSPMSIRIPDSDIILAYTAGILDGEGSIVNRHRPNAMRPTSFVSVVNTDRGLIDFLLSEFGGSVHERTIQHLGKKPIFDWHITRTRDVLAFLEALLPYLRIKRDKAVEAIAICMDGIKLISEVNREPTQLDPA